MKSAGKSPLKRARSRRRVQKEKRRRARSLATAAAEAPPIAARAPEVGDLGRALPSSGICDSIVMNHKIGCIDLDEMVDFENSFFLEALLSVGDSTSFVTTCDFSKFS